MNRGRPLVRWHGLAGQDRLFRLQAPRLDQTQVGRNTVSGLQQHHVARHERIRLDGAPRVFAQDGSVRCQHSADRGHGIFRAPLLNEADHRIGQNDREDHRRVDKVPEHGRDRRRRQQDVDENVVKVR